MVTEENAPIDFRQFFAAQSPIGLTVCDPSREDTPVVYANDRFVELTGYERTDLLGESWLTLVGPETRSERVTQVQEAIAAAESVKLDLRLHRADGEPFWDRFRLTPLFDEAGRVTAYVGLHEGVSAEKRQEASLTALHEAASRIQNEETVDAVCERTVCEAANILDFDLCSIVLRDGEWLVPRATSAEAPPDGTRRMHVDEGLAGETYQTGESYRVDDVEEDDPSKPAKETYRSGISVPVGDAGVFQAVNTETDAFDDSDVELAELLVTHTASALERIEREREIRRQNERLESLVSVVSHDLRNPLNVLDGSLELAERTAEPEHFERARRAQDRMEELIDDLLALAHHGEPIQNPTTVDVARVAEESWCTVATDDATLEADVSLELRAQEGRFRELLENLFRNAVEHGSTGPDVDDATGAITVTVGDLTDRDGFYVADDGQGVPPHLYDEVFESGVTTSEDGTGFGLSIVEQIAAAHGWEVTVTESEADGARFEFETGDGV